MAQEGEGSRLVVCGGLAQMKAVLPKRAPGRGADGTVLTYTVPIRTLEALDQRNSLMEVCPRASGLHSLAPVVVRVSTWTFLPVLVPVT